MAAGNLLVNAGDALRFCGRSPIGRSVDRGPGLPVGSFVILPLAAGATVVSVRPRKLRPTPT
ncbi:hypothetical protein ACN4EG_21050 [Alkalinema pantanalense CENA528]|uniref:hypothetical protein n=1 Tax=Alkalinema pantanalense TaxID=1620705 RepID=UPI003D6DB604